MTAEPAAVVVVHRDDEIVVVDKPSGLCVHPNRGTDRYALLHQVRDAVGQYVWPVHRLDRATSGPVVFALSKETAGRLGTAFGRGLVTKTYGAIVRGWPDPSGRIDAPLAPEDREGPPQPAVTDYHRERTWELPLPVTRYPTSRYALVRLHPRTGRTHQLRRHLAHVRHPIVGDVRHGEGRHNRVFRERFGVHRLLLWCTELTLPHPTDADALTVRVAPALEVADLLATLG